MPQRGTKSKWRSATGVRGRASCRCRFIAGRSKEVVALSTAQAAVLDLFTSASYLKPEAYASIYIQRIFRRSEMEFPDGLKYSKEHEWVLVEDKVAIIGITEFAQHELGDVVYVELPEIGEKIVKDDPFGAVESVKAVSDVFAPVSGAVVE